MNDIQYLDRITKNVETEKVYGKKALDFVYGDTLLSRLIGRGLLHTFIKYPFFSWLYGLWQKASWSKKKVAPFIKTFGLDSSEFLDEPDSFASFNDFFIRKLKPEARPIASADAIIPADARFLFYKDKIGRAHV